MASPEAIASVRRLNDLIRRFNAFNERIEADPDAWSEGDAHEAVALLSELEEARLEHRYHYPRLHPQA